MCLECQNVQVCQMCQILQDCKTGVFLTPQNHPPLNLDIGPDRLASYLFEGHIIVTFTFYQHLIQYYRGTLFSPNHANITFIFHQQHLLPIEKLIKLSFTFYQIGDSLIIISGSRFVDGEGYMDAVAAAIMAVGTQSFLS